MSVRRSLADLRAEATAEAADLRARIAAVSAARIDANTDDEHDPEGATIAFERAQAEALLALAEQRSLEAGAAIARLDSGTYGRCTMCDEPIPAARLVARPTSATCVRCA